MQLNQGMTSQRTAVPHCLLPRSASKLPTVTRLQWCLQVKAQMQDPAALKQSLSSVRLVMRVFYSMNSPGLTEVRSCGCCGEHLDALLKLAPGEPCSALKTHWHAALLQRVTLVPLPMAAAMPDKPPPLSTQASVLSSAVDQPHNIHSSSLLAFIAQEYEAVLKGWFDQFHAYLILDSRLAAETDPEKESVLDAVKAAVCQNLNLFIEMNEEEFKEYLQVFVGDVWQLLVSVKVNPGQVGSMLCVQRKKHGAHVPHSAAVSTGPCCLAPNPRQSYC